MNKRPKMTPDETVALIKANMRPHFAQKVVDCIISYPLNKLASLTPEKLAEIFQIPLMDLTARFEKRMNLYIDEYILFYKMCRAESLMRIPGKKPLNSLKISRMLGYKKHIDFIVDFQIIFIHHPQTHIQMMYELSFQNENLPGEELTELKEVVQNQ